jgi:hypothetical protein
LPQLSGRLEHGSDEAWRAEGLWQRAVAGPRAFARDRSLKQDIGMRHVYQDRNVTTGIAVPITANECAKVTAGPVRKETPPY